LLGDFDRRAACGWTLSHRLREPIEVAHGKSKQVRHGLHHELPTQTTHCIQPEVYELRDSLLNKLLAAGESTAIKLLPNARSHEWKCVHRVIHCVSETIAPIFLAEKVVWIEPIREYADFDVDRFGEKHFKRAIRGLLTRLITIKQKHDRVRESSKHSSVLTR
jgi:hypothetical protein